MGLRRRVRSAQILSGYAGFVHADAYSGYDHLFAYSKLIFEVGCWAHCRRKWDEAVDSARLPCTDIQPRIRSLYKIEARIRGEKHHRRMEVRQAESVPLLDQLYARFAENAIRPLALGRKNFLFVGSLRGGKACAMAMTFLHSAKAVGANPYEYLHDICGRIMGNPISRIHELLPAAWLHARQNR